MQMQVPGTSIVDETAHWRLVGSLACPYPPGFAYQNERSISYRHCTEPCLSHAPTSCSHQIPIATQLRRSHANAMPRAKLPSNEIRDKASHVALHRVAEWQGTVLSFTHWMACATWRFSVAHFRKQRSRAAIQSRGHHVQISTLPKGRFQETPPKGNLFLCQGTWPGLQSGIADLFFRKVGDPSLSLSLSLSPLEGRSRATSSAAAPQPLGHFWRG